MQRGLNANSFIDNIYSSVIPNITNDSLLEKQKNPQPHILSRDIGLDSKSRSFERDKLALMPHALPHKP